MAVAGFTDDKAAGRVFCNYAQGLEYMVWTQNDGHVMGVVAGPVHADVWNWWVAVHHNIGLGGAAMNMNPSSSPVARHEQHVAGAVAVALHEQQHGRMTPHSPGWQDGHQ